jgi:hypothetical protein
MAKCLICGKYVPPNNDSSLALAEAGVIGSWKMLFRPTSHLKPIIEKGEVICTGDVLASLDIVSKGKKGNSYLEVN